MGDSDILPITETTTMAAAYVNDWCEIGSVPESILYGQIPSLPSPSKMEVLVTVKAASINVDDVWLLQDTACGGWMYHTRKPSSAAPLVGGMDYAGVVAQVGSGVTKFKVGDRVCGIQKVAEYQSGTWAEQTLALEGEICHIKDDSLSFVECAAVAMGAFVGSEMVKLADSQLTARDNVRCLVIGASGALGTVLLQILRKKYNAHITAVCSTSNSEMCKQMGADEVVNYSPSASFANQLEPNVSKFSVVFDFVGGKELEAEAASLMEEHGAAFVTAVGDRQFMGADMGRPLSYSEFWASACGMLSKNCCSCSKYKYAMSQGYPPLTAEVWNTFVVDAGVRAKVAREIPFAEDPIRDALKQVASHHPGGRLVINMEKRG